MENQHLVPSQSTTSSHLHTINQYQTNLKPSVSANLYNDQINCYETASRMSKYCNRNSMSDLDRSTSQGLTTSVSAISSVKDPRTTAANNSCTTKSTTSGASSNSESHYQTMEDFQNHFPTRFNKQAYSSTTLMMPARYPAQSCSTNGVVVRNQRPQGNRWKWLLTRLRKSSETTTSSSSSSLSSGPRYYQPRSSATMIHPRSLMVVNQPARREIVHLGPTNHPANFVLNSKQHSIMVQDSPNLSLRSEEDPRTIGRLAINGQTTMGHYPDYFLRNQMGNDSCSQHHHQLMKMATNDHQVPFESSFLPSVPGEHQTIMMQQSGQPGQHLMHFQHPCGPLRMNSQPQAQLHHWNPMDEGSHDSRTPSPKAPNVSPFLIQLFCRERFQKKPQGST